MCVCDSHHPVVLTQSHTSPAFVLVRLRCLYIYTRILLYTLILHKDDKLHNNNDRNSHHCPRRAHHRCTHPPNGLHGKHHALLHHCFVLALHYALVLTVYHCIVLTVHDTLVFTVYHLCVARIHVCSMGQYLFHRKLFPIELFLGISWIFLDIIHRIKT